MLDGTVASTEAGALPVGTRIEVEWSHPTRWEAGTIVSVEVRRKSMVLLLSDAHSALAPHV